MSTNIATLALPAHVLRVLEAEGVHTLAEWRSLGRRRHQIFGITARTVARLDEAARVRK